MEDQAETPIPFVGNEGVRKYVDAWVTGQDGVSQDQTFKTLVQHAPSIAIETAKFRPSAAVTVYRAGRPGESDDLASWTYNKEFAGFLVENDSSRVLKTRKVYPNEILVDTTKLPKSMQDVTVDSQQEVIVMKGETAKKVRAVRRAAGIQYE